MSRRRWLLLAGLVILVVVPGVGTGLMVYVGVKQGRPVAAVAILILTLAAVWLLSEALIRAVDRKGARR